MATHLTVLATKKTKMFNAKIKSAFLFVFTRDQYPQKSVRDVAWNCPRYVCYGCWQARGYNHFQF